MAADVVVESAAAEGAWHQKDAEADERDSRNKEKRGRYCRDRARDLSRPHHCARHPHLPVSALQYSIGLDESDAAGRRLSFRLEIFLRLQPLFIAVLAAAVFWTHLGLAARARRRRRVSPAEGRLDRLHQAGDWVARRQNPDDRRRAEHQRRAA